MWTDFQEPSRVKAAAARTGSSPLGSDFFQCPGNYRYLLKNAANTSTIVAAFLAYHQGGGLHAGCVPEKEIDIEERL